MIEKERTEIVPIFAEYSYHRKFRSRKSKAILDVTAESTGKWPKGGVTLTVTITRTGGTGLNIKKELYSLLNLGLQGRRRRTLILEVTKGSATFRRLKRPPASTPDAYVGEKVRGPYGSDQPMEENWRIRRVTYVENFQNPEVYDEHRAWYMSFDGDICELKVVAFIEKKWDRDPGIEDDWAPPPPDPGGQYGEDEEEGDPEEEDGEEEKKKKPRKKRAG